jgi:hypothetical protein
MPASFKTTGLLPDPFEDLNINIIRYISNGSQVIVNNHYIFILNSQMACDVKSDLTGIHDYDFQLALLLLFNCNTMITIKQ